MGELREQYKELRKKYGLPDFEELNRAFEISAIEPNAFILADIRKKIAEKIEYIREVLEDLLHPNTDLKSLNECRFFNEEDKEGIFKIYKELMTLERTAFGLGLENNEKEDAEFIKMVAKKWRGIKKEVAVITDKLKQGWKKETESLSKLEYLG